VNAKTAEEKRKQCRDKLIFTIRRLCHQTITAIVLAAAAMRAYLGAPFGHHTAFRAKFFIACLGKATHSLKSPKTAIF
jgi:hypothetical protein